MESQKNKDLQIEKLQAKVQQITRILINNKKRSPQNETNEKKDRYTYDTRMRKSLQKILGYLG